MLEDWQYDQLRAIAEREGRSLAALVREIVGRHLKERSKRAAKELSSLSGIGEGPADLGRDHDRYLYGEE